MTRSLLPRWLLLVVVGHISPSFGQDAGGAELLLKQGQQQVAAGKLEEGCASFAKALVLHNHPRIRVNLAACYEKQGKLASAWAEFVEASRLSRGLSDQSPQEKKRQAFADEQSKRLEPRLSFLQIELERKVPGIRIFRGATSVPDGVKIPIDPGKYTIKVEAPGHVAWSAEASTEGEGATKIIRVPALVPESSSLPAPSASAPPSASASAPPPSTAMPPASASASSSLSPLPRGSARSTAGLILGGAGLVVTGVGFFFGLRASSAYDSAKKQCPLFRECSPSAMDLREQAELRANIANVAVGGGLLAIGIGTYLLLTRSPPESGQVVGAPWVDRNGGGMQVWSSF